MMMGSKVLRLLVVAAVGTALAGCRIKSVESFESAVNPSPPSPGKGDPYTYGGVAEGTGGLSTKTSYATDTNTPDPLSATETGKAGRIDQPRVQLPSAPASPSTIKLNASSGAPAKASAAASTSRP
jgi:hypothetical protein